MPQELLDEQQAKKLFEHAYREGLQAKLTARQATVAAHVCQGLSNHEIGRVNNVTEKTVKFHLGAIYKHLSVRTRLQMVLRLLKGFTL